MLLFCSSSSSSSNGNTAPDDAGAGAGAGAGGSVILELLRLYAPAAAIPDHHGWLPMHHYVQHQTEWGEEAEALYRAHEPALRVRTTDNTTTDTNNDNNNNNDEHVPSRNRRLALHTAASNPRRHNTPVITRLVELNPRACQQVDGDGKLPLHIICENIGNKDWEDGVETIYSAYEEAIRTKEDNNRRWFPLQIVAAMTTTTNTTTTAASSRLIQKLAELYPEAAQDVDYEGKLALHRICEAGCRGWEDGIRAVFRASPEANFSPDHQGKLPFHYAALRFARKELEGANNQEQEELAGDEEEDDDSSSSSSSSSPLSDVAQVEVLFELLRAHPIIIQ
mmetsp:Transcript_19430/g.28060  ORF Transcript_19430/g.28060 Transcript_19430/m.28060 type:complete len:337 (-) Transcript_19430:207-1217(-)